MSSGNESELLALGLSHRTAPVDLRERVALTEGRAAGVMRELRAEGHALEAAVISTCNRTELYLLAGDPVEAESLALGILAREAEIRPTELAGALYSLRGPDAGRHLYRVAGGLDSMIIGETEIQGQVKRAYELALVEGASGPVLNRLFRGALAAGKRAREETAIARGGMSVPSVAVELAQRTVGSLHERRTLIIGAGETAELTARALAARGSRPVFVANRHHARALGLAQRFGGQAVRIDDLPEQLASSDIVVSSTASPHHILERDELELVVAERGGTPLIVIDIAVPRDVAPECRDIPGVTLRDIDDLQAIVERNASGRNADARDAEAIVGAEYERFHRWLASLDALPTVSALRSRAESIVEQVLAENAGRWESLSDADQRRVEAMARALVNRILHEPTLRLKGTAGNEDAYVLVEAARELFGLAPALGLEEANQDATVTPLRRHSEP